MLNVNEISKKDLIKNLFPGFSIFEYFILNEPITVLELDRYFSKSKSTYYRMLNKLIDFGLIKKIPNIPKIKKHAQFLYVSTPKLKLILNMVFHWMGDLTLRGCEVELANPLNFEFLKETNSLFSDIILPEIKEWVVANWEEFSNPSTFFKEFSERVLQRVELRLENIIIKKVTNQVRRQAQISEEF